MFTGILGYKQPGLLKKFIPSKKFFWFGEEPIHHKSLSNYLRGEKPEVGNRNAAWSSTTGKGLLFFSKHASEKTSPAGVINLVGLLRPVMINETFTDIIYRPIFLRSPRMAAATSTSSTTTRSTPSPVSNPL
jgi:hypothetical protein